MTRASRILVCALLLVLFGSGVAHAKEFYEAYEDGLKSVESKNWNDVVAKMTEAIGKNAKEDRRTRTYGANFIPYHPYYYRGIAYFNLGKYEQAIADLQRALGVGRVNLGTPDSWVLRAESRMAMGMGGGQQTPPPPPPTATQVVVVPPPPPPPTATQVVVVPPPTTTRPPVVPPPTTTRPPVVTTTPVTTPVVTTPVTTGPALKAKVRDALRAYFNGDFQRSEIALDLLSKEQGSNAMIWAFLGASKYNTYILSGESNGSMKLGAEEAFRKARQLKPSMQLSAKYFSPRVRNFFESIN